MGEEMWDGWKKLFGVGCEDGVGCRPVMAGLESPLLHHPPLQSNLKCYIQNHPTFQQHLHRGIAFSPSDHGSTVTIPPNAHLRTRLMLTSNLIFINLSTGMDPSIICTCIACALGTCVAMTSRFSMTSKIVRQVLLTVPKADFFDVRYGV